MFCLEIGAGVQLCLFRHKHPPDCFSGRHPAPSVEFMASRAK
jgi:hypothetical protein